MTTQNLVKQEQASIFRNLGLILRILFGAVFVFSGFVKAIDPLGTAYKMQDYLHAMGFMQFDNLALAGSILMLAFEFTIGLTLVSGIKMKLFSWCALLFMLAMTPLTFWIWMKNPVTDCGCFGDFLIISNSATFWKNIVLLAIIITIIYCEKYHRPFLSPLPSWLVSASFFMFSVCISIYCLAHLPMFDFRPFKIGKNIPEQMIIPEGKPHDEYKTFFIYKNKKSGEKKEFSLNNLPYIDTISWKIDTVNWEYIDQKTEVKKGYEPPIHDFMIESQDYGDITDEVLSDTNFVFLFVMYDLKKTCARRLNELNTLYSKLNGKGLRVMALTSSIEDEIAEFRAEYGAEYPFFFTDATALKTAIRANPGVIVIKSGTVIDKWNANDTKKAFKKFAKKQNLVIE
ncbi:MAG: DoxX family protein [Prevotellaceae bacterium]|jgi:uncharacterized membrane protein YphA (DoxX/SURF4 family)/peroxiredoxin|nr:DoxX family protein [Prevotellaceae bacterium]